MPVLKSGVWKKPEINMWGKKTVNKSLFIFDSEQLCINEVWLYLVSECLFWKVMYKKSLK